MAKPNRRFHKELTDAGITHDYREHPGDHNWDYWNTHIADALAFHARALGIEQP